MRIVDGWTETKQEEVLDALNVLALEWRIEEDFYNYCAQMATKEELQGAVPKFPRSYLQPVVNDLAIKIIHVPRNFPREYLAALGAKPAGDAALGDVELPPRKPAPTGFEQMVALSQKEPKTKSDDRSADPLRVKGWHNLCHEKFEPLCQSLRTKNKSISLNKGLKMANMTMEDLPKLDCTDSADPPRKGPCWKFLLGNCPGGEKCNFVHIHPSWLPDEVVETCLPVLKKVAKGLEEVMSSEKEKPHRKRKRATGTNSVTWGS